MLARLIDTMPQTVSALRLNQVGRHPGVRVLAWHGEVLYACRGYQLLRMKPPSTQWEPVADFLPAWWRRLTARNRLSHRLVRDGFHALAVVGERERETLVGAVPGAIVTKSPDDPRFRVTHQVTRGTRPLHITAVPSGDLYWGEYFDNRERSEVHIYASRDRGNSWTVAHTFPSGSIRHVHNLVHDPWLDCLWILTGDDGDECRVLRASCDLHSIEVVLQGNQQARAVAAIPTRDALYLATDTPSERNHVYRLDREGNISPVGDLASSSIYGCRTAGGMFFSTMAEPSALNTTREVTLVGSNKGAGWPVLARWQKDAWPMRYFQYGNVFLPDGENSTRYLAATTVAVNSDDLVTTLWEVETA